MSMLSNLPNSGQGELTWEERLRRGAGRSRLTLNPEYQELKFKLG